MAARAGSAYVDFRGEFSQLRRDLAVEMQKLGKERIDIKGDVDVDTRGFTTKVARARKTAEAQVAKPIVQTLAGDFDTGGFQRWAQANDQAERSVRAKKIETRLGFDVDDSELARYRAIREKLQRDAGRQEAFKLRLGADFDQAAFSAFNREVDNSDRSLNRVTRSAAGTTTALGGLSLMARKTTGSFFSFGTRIPIVQIGVLGGVLYNAVGGVTSLVGALAPLTGLLGAIGPLATSAAQGIGTINLATAGVGDAIKSAFAEQDKAAIGSTVSLNAAASAAEGVREATLSLEAAERTQRFAIEDVGRAREEGTRQIEDMRAAVRDLALEEEGATLGLKEAKQALNQLVSEGADQLEVDRAVLRVKEARSELQKTRREGQRTRSDLGAVGAAGGVKELPQVVQARRSLADANRGVAEAERELAAAAKRSSEALAGGGAAADAAAQKLAKLPPAAQDYVKFIIGLRPKIKQLQATAAEGLLPGVERGIKSAMRNFPVLNRIIAGTSKVLGDLAEQAGKRLGSDEWGKDLETQGKRNEVTIGRLGTAGLNLAEAFKDVTLAAGPLVDRLTKWVVALTDGWKESANAARESGRLQAFFKDAGDTFFKTVRILRDLAVSFKNIGSAARQAFGNELLGGIERGARALREWTGSIQGQRELVGVFRDIGDNLKAAGRFVEDLVQDFRRLREEGNTTGQALSKIFIDVLEDLVAQAAESGGRLAIAFAKGWLKADWFGRVFGAALLIQRFGGPAAWAAIGTKLGASFGIGVTTGATGAIAAKGGMAVPIGMAAAPAAAAGVATGAAAGSGLLAGLRQKVTGSGISKSISPGLKAGGLGAALLFAEPFLKGVLEKIDRGFEGSVGNTLRRTLGDKLGSIVSTALKTFTPGGLIRAPKNLFNLGKDLFGFGEQKDEVSGQVQELRDKVQAMFGKGVKLKLDIETVGGQRDFAKIETNFNRLKNRLAGDATSIARVSRQQLGLMARYMDLESTAGQQAVTKNMRLTLRAINASLNTGASSAKASMRAIRESFRVNSAASKDTAQKNFGLARDAIKAAVDSSKITARQGLKVVRGLFKDYLGTFGIKGRAAEIYLRNVPKTSGGGGKSGGVPLNYARGGPIQRVAGRGLQDTVPLTGPGIRAMVAPGEDLVALNRHQRPLIDAAVANQYGVSGLPGFFDRFRKPHSAHQAGGTVERFATGGAVSPGGLFDGHPGNVSAGVKKLIELMKGRFPALQVTSTTDHSKLTTSGNISDHWSGHAVDLASGDYGYMNKAASYVKTSGLYKQIKQGIHNPNLAVADGQLQTPPGQFAGQTWAQHLNHIHLAVAGALKAVVAATINKIGPFKIGGPDSPLKAGVAAGLDRVRTAANEALGRAAADFGGMDVDTDVRLPKGEGSRANRILGKRMAARFGWGSGPQWSALDDLWGRLEGSWDENLANLAGSGAYGIAQALPSSKYPAAGEPSAPPGIQKAKAQIGWGLNYIKGRYGDPLAAHAFRLANNYYGEGGLVGPAQMLATGGLVQPLRKTLRRVTKGATKKKRSKALDAFKRKIGKLGLPAKLQTAILGQLEQHERFSDLASRANGLSTTDENTGVTQLAKIGNKNEGGWLVDDLSVLTALRNNLLKVRKIILERKAKLEAVLKGAQEQLKKLSKAGRTPKGWKGLNPAKDSIAKWNKQPGDKRQKRVKEWHKKRGSLPGDREFAKDGKLLVGPGRRKRALQELIPSLKNQRSNLLDGAEGGLGTYGSSGDGMLGSLFSVQGYPASGDLFKRYMTLPPLGEFGGYIGTAQQALADLGESLRARSDSSATSDVFDSGRGERLEELLRLERQRTLIRDIEVAELLRSARQPPFAGAFATGGTVPGPVGAARTAIVHGGEIITPPGQDNGRFRLIVEDHRVRVYRNDVEMIVDQKLRGVSRGVGRTPGLAGSLKP